MSVSKKISTYIIGDIHGCYYTLIKLVKKLEKNSRLIFVGDLVDKGNFSKEVVEYVIENNHLCILGNHEYLMLKHIEEKLDNNIASSWSEKEYFGGYKTILQYKNNRVILKKHLKWIKKLPQYIEIDKYFITHAFALPYYKRRDLENVKTGLMSNRPSDKDEWGWDWEKNYEEYHIINIYGHEVVKEIDINKNYIGIDTGSVYGKKLSAIELGTHRVISVDVDERDIY